VGGLIGLVIGSISLFFKNNVTAKRVILKSFWIILCTTVVFAFVGFVVGKFYLIKTDVGWWLPEDLQDKNSFILVGTIHNFSYLGGGAGLLVALIYLIIKLIRQFNHH
jgi:predicted permease